MLKKVLAPLLLLAILVGCASAPVQHKTVSGAAIETLQGSVNVALTSPGGQMSGNGFLFYQKPDNFRLSILAPFGQVVFDIIVSGKKVLCLQESRKIAWRGTVADLPPTLGTKVWPLLQWIMEPSSPAGASLQRFFKRADGSIEIIYYEPDGLVQQKINSAGDEVFYSDYRLSGERVFANRIELLAAEGSRLVLTFDAPDLNLPIDSAVLKPDLTGYEIRPLGELNGFSSWQ
jgi:hypothetical protein